MYQHAEITLIYISCLVLPIFGPCVLPPVGKCRATMQSGGLPIGVTIDKVSQQSAGNRAAARDTSNVQYYFSNTQLTAQSSNKYLVVLGPDVFIRKVTISVSDRPLLTIPHGGWEPLAMDSATKLLLNLFIGHAIGTSATIGTNQRAFLEYSAFCLEGNGAKIPIYKHVTKITDNCIFAYPETKHDARLSFNKDKSFIKLKGLVDAMGMKLSPNGTIDTRCVDIKEADHIVGCYVGRVAVNSTLRVCPYTIEERRRRRRSSYDNPHDAGSLEYVSGGYTYEYQGGSSINSLEKAGWKAASVNDVYAVAQDILSSTNFDEQVADRNTEEIAAFENNTQVELRDFNHQLSVIRDNNDVINTVMSLASQNQARILADEKDIISVINRQDSIVRDVNVLRESLIKESSARIDYERRTNNNTAIIAREIQALSAMGGKLLEKTTALAIRDDLLENTIDINKNFSTMELNDHVKAIEHLISNKTKQELVAQWVSERHTLSKGASSIISLLQRGKQMQITRTQSQDMTFRSLAKLIARLNNQLRTNIFISSLTDFCKIGLEGFQPINPFIKATVGTFTVKTLGEVNTVNIRTVTPLPVVTDPTRKPREKSYKSGFFSTIGDIGSDIGSFFSGTLGSGGIFSILGKLGKYWHYIVLFVGAVASALGIGWLVKLVRNLKSMW